jgi:hypothetical protein
VLRALRKFERFLRPKITLKPTSFLYTRSFALHLSPFTHWSNLKLSKLQLLNFLDVCEFPNASSSTLKLGTTFASQ